MGIHGKYDHEIKIGTTTKRFNIATGEGGETLYQVTEDIPTYKDPLRVTQTNWIDGHGQHDTAITDMYFDGQSIDTTQEGRFFAGPLISEVQEDDDSDLDSTPVCFLWFARTSELLCATSGEIYRYIADDTTINMTTSMNTTVTSVVCSEDASTAIPVGSTIFIESEQMFVTATGTTLTVIRDFHGTTAASHTATLDIYRYKWTAQAGTAITGVTHMVEFNRVAYAAVGSSTYYWYSTDGDSWSQTDLGYAQKFLSAPDSAGTSNRLWKTRAAVANPNEISETSDGTSVAWSSPAYIGDKSNVITNIFLSNDDLMVGKTDNLYYYDPNGGVHPLMDELKHNRTTRNFQYVTHWEAGTYFSLVDGLGEITARSAFSRMGPLTDIDDINRVGHCVGLTSDKNWLYVAMDEGTNTVIYKGKEVRKKEALRWQWCPFVFLGTETCATLKFVQHSADDKRLWFGYTNSTGYVNLYDDPTADSDARFAAASWIRMSYNYGTNQYWDKMFQSIVTETEGCSANVNVTPKYRKDTDTGNGTALTAAIITNGTVKTNLTTALSCKRIQFELHLATNSSSSTPIVKLFEARGIEKPETIVVHDVTYAIGSTPSKEVKTIKTFLEGGRTSTTLMKFADLRFKESTAGTSTGDYVWVVMEPGFPKIVALKHEKGRQPELGIQVRLQEVSFTIS